MKRTLSIRSAELKPKTKIGWTPRFKIETRSDLDNKTFFSICRKAAEELEWELNYYDDHTLEFLPKASWGRNDESIKIQHQFGKVSLQSESIKAQIDLGRNSKKIIALLQEIEKLEEKYTLEDLKEWSEEIESKNNWDDYVIPENLPAPPPYKKPSMLIPIMGGVLCSLIIGYFIGWLEVNRGHFLGFMELIIGLGIAYPFKLWIRLGNYNQYIPLRNLIIGLILLNLAATEFSQYLILFEKYTWSQINFFQYLDLRLQEGLNFDGHDLGSIGLIAAWALSLGLSYLIAFFRLNYILIAYTIKRVPQEVVDFAFYHFIKDKSESEVRQALNEKGWSRTQDQNAVFEAVDAIGDSIELNRK